MLGWIHQPLEGQSRAVWSVSAFLPKKRKSVHAKVSTSLYVSEAGVRGMVW